MRRLRWLVVGLVLCACMPNWDTPNAPGDDAPFVFEVPKGATGGGLGPKLAEAGLVPTRCGGRSS